MGDSPTSPILDFEVNSYAQLTRNRIGISVDFNILLVEDNDDFRRMLANALLSQFAAITVTEVTNGEDGLLKAEDLNPDIVFMDISLPGENGLEATRKVKALPKDTRVVILTSYDIPEYRQQALRNGADYFISKSDDSCVLEIIAQVKKMMAHKGAETLEKCTCARRRPFLPVINGVLRASCGVMDSLALHLGCERMISSVPLFLRDTSFTSRS